MIYLKHPTLGNRHAKDDERQALEADGWVVWPREVKADPPADEPVNSDENEPHKPRRGRPPKE